MSTSQIEQLREKIWDYLFHNGQQSIEGLAEKFDLIVPVVKQTIDCDWFVVEGQQVTIAKSRGHN